MTKISQLSWGTLFMYFKKHYSCVLDLTASNLMKYLFLSYPDSLRVSRGSHRHHVYITEVAINMSKQGEVSCQSFWLMTDIFLNACDSNCVVSRSWGSAAVFSQWLRLRVALNGNISSGGPTDKHALQRLLDTFDASHLDCFWCFWMWTNRNKEL